MSVRASVYTHRHGGYGSLAVSRGGSGSVARGSLSPLPVRGWEGMAPCGPAERERHRDTHTHTHTHTLSKNTSPSLPARHMGFEGYIYHHRLCDLSTLLSVLVGLLMLNLSMPCEFCHNTKQRSSKQMYTYTHTHTQ